MSRTVAYFFTPVSPWTYLGHERLRAIVRATGSAVEVLPVDYAVIFPASGGLPLAKRAPQRQAHRAVELRRFREHLGLPLNVQPRYFPVDGGPASRLIVAVDRADGAERALGLAGARLAEASDPAIDERYRANTQCALDAGVFGAPSVVIEGEIFWGQDRLEFVERALRKT